MSHNDRQMNGQHRPNSILDQVELPPVKRSKQRRARLRTAWRESWAGCARCRARGAVVGLIE